MSLVVSSLRGQCGRETESNVAVRAVIALQHLRNLLQHVRKLKRLVDVPGNA